MEQLAATPVHRLEVVLRQAAALPGHRAVRRRRRRRWRACCSSTCRSAAASLLLAVHVAPVPARRLGLGIFISAGAKSQVLATQVAMVATYLPGAAPVGLHVRHREHARRRCGRVTYVVPARYFVVVTRGIFLKGVGHGGALGAGRCPWSSSRPSGSGWRRRRSRRGSRERGRARSAGASRIRTLVRKELRQLFRDPRTASGSCSSRR